MFTKYVAKFEFNKCYIRNYSHSSQNLYLMLITVQKGKLIRQKLVWCVSLVFCLHNINVSYGSRLDSNLRPHECGASTLPLSCDQP